jgi:hypothetical protein
MAPLTVRITGKKLTDQTDAWSHMGIGFQLSNHSIIYYENLFRDGFQGPKPFGKLIAFRDGGGRLSVQWFDFMHTAVCQAKREKCEAWAGKHRGYFGWQLAAMWKFERILRFYHRHIRPSPDRGVCSEDVARLLYPELDLRDTERDFDEVNPNSSWRKYRELKGVTNDAL